MWKRVLLVVFGLLWIISSLGIAVDETVLMDRTFAPDRFLYQKIATPDRSDADKIEAAEQAGIERARRFWRETALTLAAFLAINTVVLAILAWQLAKRTGYSVPNLLGRVPLPVWLFLVLTQALSIPGALKFLSRGDEPAFELVYSRGYFERLACFILLPLFLSLAVWRWRVGPPSQSPLSAEKGMVGELAASSATIKEVP